MPKHKLPQGETASTATNLNQQFPNLVAETTPPHPPCHSVHNLLLFALAWTYFPYLMNQIINMLLLSQHGSKQLSAHSFVAKKTWREVIWIIVQLHICNVISFSCYFIRYVKLVMKKWYYQGWWLLLHSFSLLTYSTCVKPISEHRVETFLLAFFFSADVISMSSPTGSSRSKTKCGKRRYSMPKCQMPAPQSWRTRFHTFDFLYVSGPLSVVLSKERCGFIIRTSF